MSLNLLGGFIIMLAALLVALLLFTGKTRRWIRRRLLLARRSDLKAMNTDELYRYATTLGEVHVSSFSILGDNTTRISLSLPNMKQNFSCEVDEGCLSAGLLTAIEQAERIKKALG